MSLKTPVRFILGTHTVGDTALAPGIVHFDTAKDVQALLDAFYSRGYREIDTARNYTEGASEERLGNNGSASRFLIHSKVLSGTPGDHKPQNIEQSIEQSLNALKTTSVETMFLHVPDRQTPFEDTVKAMHDALQQGKFKKFGLSNYTAAEVQEILDICERKGYTQPSVFQGHYNAIVRGGEQELFPLLRKYKIAFWAYSPAAGGFFSDHASTAARWKNDNIVGKLYNHHYGSPAVRASVTTFRNAAEKHGINGHAAALRWTAFHSSLEGNFGDGLTFGVSEVDQLHNTLDALESGPLPAELADIISAIYATVEGNEPPYHL